MTNPKEGVEYLLTALSAREETSEMKTYELFEKALYKVVQKSDEAPHSFSLRLQAAFDEIGADVKIQEMQAFVMLKQSCLSADDKKKILAMTGGKLELKAVDQAVRSLSTRVLLGPGETKKKVYPVNFTEVDDTSHNVDENQSVQSTFTVTHEDEEALTMEHLEQLAAQGDEDALTVQQFERDFEDLMQEVPDMQVALISYQEARQRSGFWPTHGRNKGKGFSKSGFQGFRKGGGGKSGKDELMARIARTHCKQCGQLGHWKAECPLRPKEVSAPKKSNVNIVQAMSDEPFAVDDAEYDPEQVIFEVVSQETQPVETCFMTVSNNSSMFSPQVRAKVLQFWGKRLRPKSDKSALHRAPGFQKGISSNHTARMTADRPEATQKATVCPVTRLPIPKLQLPINIAKSETDGQSAETSQFRGMAILDTGASRSVIGQEHVPIMLEKLPASVRQRVKEQPSRIGFRFGNNQIAYSYKQLRIPVVNNKTRLWLIVEVVPKVTPFLLSIKTMKSLGAVIDLAQNACFLKTINRSLPLKENRNGLFMIDMGDLCQTEESSSAAVFVASTCVPPPGLESEVPVKHADSSGSPRCSPSGCRGSPQQPQVSADLDLHDDQGCGTRDGSQRGADESSHNQLIAEVTAQRRKIEQLGTLIQTQCQKPPTTPGYVSSPVQEIGSESDWEETELANMTAHPGKRRQSLAQTSNPPAMMPSVAQSSSQAMPMVMIPMPTPAVPAPQVPPMPKKSQQPPSTPGTRTSRANTASPQPCLAGSNNSEIGNQLMVTQATLESWGAKIVDWGKKHQGKSYCAVFDQDQSYVRWVLARAHNMGEDMLDFARYAIARQQLEQLAMPQ